MKKSFIGIVDRFGLQLLTPEYSHTARFLSRRSVREHSLCFWAVIDDSIAAAIQAELSVGDSRHALTLLECLAIEVGTVLPSDNKPLLAADRM